jgi:hypothetical protein
MDGIADLRAPRLPFLPVAESPAVIPPVLHRIWVGPTDDIPEWVTRSWARWDLSLQESRHDWTTYEWTNQSIIGTPLERAADVARYYGLPPRGQADLIRVMAVSLWGGFYMDADVVLLRSLDDLVFNPAVRVWTTSHAESFDQQVLWNGGFGAEPHSEYMAEILSFAQKKLQRGVTNEHFLAGPRAYRTFLPDYAVTEWDFQFECTMRERRIMAAGGEFDLADMRRAYPARVKHIGPKED